MQQFVTQKIVELAKVLGSENLADLGTKHVDAATMWKLLGMMGFVVREGRSKIAMGAVT